MMTLPGPNAPWSVSLRSICGAPISGSITVTALR